MFGDVKGGDKHQYVRRCNWIIEQSENISIKVNYNCVKTLQRTYISRLLQVLCYE